MGPLSALTSRDKQCHTYGVRDAEDWTVRSAWMRSVGATSATWHPDGALASVVLAPLVVEVEPIDAVAPTVRPEPRAGSRLVQRPEGT